jgi:hypothetical protein
MVKATDLGELVVCRPCHLTGHPASIMGTIEDGGERVVLSFVVVSVLAALGEG